MGEFDLIDFLTSTQTIQRQDVALGIGDDCALLDIPPSVQLALSMDTLVAGIHFKEETDAYDIGYKAAAVNFSDLAAMGAEPAWVTLALTLPEINREWLKDFSEGFFTLLKQFNVQLIGGDTTRGPLSITVQAHGFVPKGKVLKRSGAKKGDLIYVTGSLGDAGLALSLGDDAPCELSQRLLRPTPRIAEGKMLREIAHSAIDISDGLVADLSHILKCSGKGATLYVDSLPLSKALLAHTSYHQAQVLALSAGDDYELCFTIAPENIHALGFEANCIGVIEETSELRLLNRDGSSFILESLGYKHFS